MTQTRIPMTRTGSIQWGWVKVLIRGENGARKQIVSTHLPLRIVATSDIDFAFEQFSVADGERIYLYSDGLTETRLLPERCPVRNDCWRSLESRPKARRLLARSWERWNESVGRKHRTVT